MLAFGLVVAAAALSARGGTGSCLQTAHTAVTDTGLTLTLLGESPQRIAPAEVDEVICADLAGDGRRDVALTIASGGTAGDVGFAVLVRTASGWAVALKGNGYKLGLARIGDQLDVSQPIYKKNDPNCCPTGGFEHTRYAEVGHRFVVIKRSHTSSYRP